AWPKKYDMILANIQKSVILEILEPIRNLLSRDGVLLVSGILTVEDESIRQAFTNHGLNLIESKQDGEWVAYILQHDSMRYV
ncbi:50S ribosomal protein L11 methyltransferase, partial [bacterium]|nr:50S ribosomal protein L11 methyltransferase [bacterium]